MPPIFGNRKHARKKDRDIPKSCTT